MFCTDHIHKTLKVPNGIQSINLNENCAAICRQINVLKYLGCEVCDGSFAENQGFAQLIGKLTGHLNEELRLTRFISERSTSVYTLNLVVIKPAYGLWVTVKALDNN